MDTPLRVLFVAASATDAGPLIEELARAGLEVSGEIVCNAAELQTALRRGEWDLVLSDDEIPGFGAVPALTLTRAAGLDVPFLVVSDGMGDDRRESLLREGARNCLANGSLPEIASHVERELAGSRLQRERRRARRALAESESRFHALAEAANDAILTADGHGRIVFANRAAEGVFGQPVAAIVGRPIERLIPGVLALAAGAEGAPSPDGPVGEHAGIHADGREIPLQLSLGSLTRDGRRFTTVVARDVSERRNAERALRESEERFRVAAQISSDLVYEWNIETGDVVFLHGSSRGLPSTREEWEKLVHPEDRGRVLASMRRTLETDQPFLEEYRIVLADGSVRVRVGYGKVLRDGEGRPVKWIGVNKDVTERRRTQNALKDSEEKLRTLVANVPVVLFAIDRHGIVTHSEGKGLESLGLEPGEVVGKSVWDFYRKYPDVLEHVRRALSGDAHTATVRVGETSFETRYARTATRTASSRASSGSRPTSPSSGEPIRRSKCPNYVTGRCSSEISRGYFVPPWRAGSSSATSPSPGSSATPHPRRLSTSRRSTSTCVPGTVRPSSPASPSGTR